MKRARMRALVAASLVALMALPAACAGSSLNNEQPGREGPIRVGVMWPTSGVLQLAGEDFIKGWDLFLKTHDNKLGGQDVEITLVDEGDGQAAAQTGIKQLIEQDNVEVVVGALSSEAQFTINGAATQAKIPYVDTAGRPDTFPDMTYTWCTGMRTSDPGRALVDYIRENVDGPVWAMGPDFIGGWSYVKGFSVPFVAAGGKLANPNGEPTWTPYPVLDNFAPYLNQILASDAKAVYVFYAGAMTIQFVKTYAQVIGDKIPLYAAGPAVEGDAVLGAMEDAADGIYSSNDYAADLDNAANRAFVTAFQAEYGSAPTQPNMQGWDGALALDLAIAAAGPDPTSESINAAFANLGTVPSPRGDWKFDSDNAPIQPWYLRQVRTDGRGRTNVMVQTLGVIGAE